jgi:glutathionyl-hydroquinone reductase
MKFLVDGRWTDELPSRHDSSEQGVVHAGGFRCQVTSDGSSAFSVEPGRYHLYVSHACPFSHRVTALWTLMALGEAIDLSILHPQWQATDGWVFGASPLSTNDKGGGDYTCLRDVYLACSPDYTGRVSVPVLWDKVKRTIVNNESIDIIKMLNREFRPLGSASLPDLYPEALKDAIDSLNVRIGRFLANGVYNVAGAKEQAAYDLATRRLFDFMEELEQWLAQSGHFLLRSGVTLADILAFTALVRFDPVYAPLFRIGGKRLADFPALTAYMKRVHDVPGIAGTVHYDHILAHYYDSDWSIPPRRGIVPNLAEMAWYR